MRIYGSFATGCATDASDIDIVIVSEAIGPVKLLSLKQELEKLFAREVDLVERHALFPILRGRIQGELTAIDKIVAGEFAVKRPKSPYLYLLIIQNEARDIVRERHFAGEGKHRVGARARRIAHFFQSRYKPLAAVVAESGLPIRQIRELSRISDRATHAKTNTAIAFARVRRLSRKIVKRLRLAPNAVEADIRCDYSGKQ